MPARPLSLPRAGLLVLAGGTLGTLGRHGVTVWWSDPGTWPWPTFAVNVIGSFLLGLVVARVRPDDPRRLLLGTGVLGGFTTYSAFAVETDRLLRDDHVALAALYPTVTVTLGFFAALAGLALGRARPGPQGAA
ncbi:fluoride efflux transporter FluC [Aeromicrobium sp. CF3.5]|uniref:fluoride efflux transporter FluC n=1 Tax=Aeromicrobium sp. CF3.5 TaxID=3373078 RepID=UPI003EE4E413